MRRLAQLTLETLRPEGRVFVEWSDEVWRDLPSRPQSDDARGKGPVQAERSAAVFRIFGEVFRDRSRLVRVIASESGNVAAHRALLAAAGLKSLTDALAIAPHFGAELAEPSRREWLSQAKVEEILDLLEKTSLPATVARIGASADFARKAKLDLLAYGGGPVLDGPPGFENDWALAEKLDAVRRHPKMKVLLMALLDAWRTAGGQTFVYDGFDGQPGRFGRFGRPRVPRSVDRRGAAVRRPRRVQHRPPALVVITAGRRAGGT